MITTTSISVPNSTLITTLNVACKSFLTISKKDKKVIVCHFPMILRSAKRMYKEHLPNDEILLFVKLSKSIMLHVSYCILASREG